jgi:hypothetical protein
MARIKSEFPNRPKTGIEDLNAEKRKKKPAFDWLNDEDIAEVMKREKDEQMEYFCAFNGEPLEDYLPDVGNKWVPDGGQWIQIIYPPFTEYTVEHLSIWFALPVVKKETFDLIHRYSDRYKVKILTPKGELHLFPHEYNLVSEKTLNSYLNAPDGAGFSVHWLDPRNEFFDADKLLYITSRGIRKSDAYRMLLGEIQSPHVCFMTFHAEYQKMFAGVGIPKLNARQVILNHINRTEALKAAGQWY